MIRTDNRPLKETPDVLNSIGVDITPYPFLSTMVDSLMPSVMASVNLTTGATATMALVLWNQEYYTTMDMVSPKR